MSDIKVGDLVMQVRGHKCVLDVAGGIPFVVTEIISPPHGPWDCGKCGMQNVHNGPVAERTPRIAIAWLKKIDPPSEPERVERHEELSV